MRFTDVFVRRPVLASVVSLLILLIGLQSLFALGVRQYPELKNTVIRVTTAYAGASPELMKGPMKDALDAINSNEKIFILA